MSTRFLFIVDPLHQLSVETDSTLAIMSSCQARGVSTFACELSDIYLRDGVVNFFAAPVQFVEGASSVAEYREPKAHYSVHNFAAVFMRKDPPVDNAFVAALLMLRCYDPGRTSMINCPDGLLRANEKLFGLSIAPDLFPPTLVASQKKTILEFLAQHGRVVCKPLFQAGGAGVLVFDQSDRNLSSALELLTCGYSRAIMVQAFIKNARAGDKRVLILGGKAIGAINRVPAHTDHRSNFHAGGVAEATVLSERDHQIVNALTPHLQQMGLHFVGIDIIDGMLTEINVTSPTCVIEIEKFSQDSGSQRLREKIVDSVLSLIQQKESR